MSIQPPKIDSRSYDKIVNQTVKLAQHFTADIDVWTALVERTSEGLQDRILAEDIIDIGSDNNEIIATAGTLVTPQLAKEIVTRQAASLVKVKVKDSQEGQGNESVKPTPELLKDRILNENIIDIDGQIIAKTGDSVNDDLAKKIAEVKTKLVKVKGWQGRNDAGMGLIRIFGRMAALVSDRLNQAPDKNFLAFLDLIGTQIQPPQPARVPLTFNLVEGSSVETLVPAGTQVSAPPLQSDEEEVVFETERDLAVVSNQIKAVFVRDPSQDKYSDRTQDAIGNKNNTFHAFRGDESIEQCFYLTNDELFATSGIKTVTLTINSPEASDKSKLPPMSWSYFDGTRWKDISVNTADAIKNQWEITIQEMPIIPISKIDGLEGRWLRAGLNKSDGLNQLKLISQEAEKGSDEKPEVTKLKVNTVTGIKVGDLIRITRHSNQQEDCPIKKVDDGETKFLTLEKKLNYEYPGETLIQLLPKLPTVNYITASSTISVEGLAPDLCFFNSTPLDISKDFYPFGEQPRFNDTFYIASREVFAKADAKVNITVTLSQGVSVYPDGGIQLAWEYWDGHKWIQTDSTITKDDSKSFKNPGDIKFTRSPQIVETTVNGETNYWVRVRIVAGNYGTQAVGQTPIITTLKEKAQKADNTLKVNSVRGFMPNDFTWIGLGTNQAKKLRITQVNSQNNILTLENAIEHDYSQGTSVMLSSDSNLNPPLLQPLKLSCEYKNDFLLSACRTHNNPNYIDISTAITEVGNSNQNQIQLKTIQGWEVSEQLLIAQYEKDEKGERKLITQKVTIDAIDRSNKKVTLKEPLARTYNKETTVVFHPFELFTPTIDEKPTLYLGFDRPFPNRAIALYLQVEPPQPGDIAKAIQAANNPTTDLPRIIWEYYNSKSWVSLGVKDETNAFTQRGIIEFIAPPDFTHQNEFGQTLYWIRARWESGEFLVQPRLRRILTNTIWASQVITIKEELLGSSDGQPKQTYRTAQFPVLKGQRLEVRNPQVPSADELAALEKSLGKKALTIVSDDLGRIEEVWVMWEKVRDFYGSSQTDRHYTIDHLTGVVQFGDGVQGMIPSQGRNNIRFAQYRTGGGKKGNLAENKIAQLKTTIPYVESVTNLEAAGGGAEQESLERVKERGPKWLRHRDRAVTIQDFEDLAYEASTEVARAKAIAPQFDPFQLAQEKWIDKPEESSPQNFPSSHDAGTVKLIVVPNSTASQPVPSISLLDRVKTYIHERCSPVINLQITEPDWVKVSVTANIVPISMDVADRVKAAAENALLKFLHPLTGGRKGQGWAFGRLLHESDLYAFLESLEGVDYIKYLKLKQELLWANNYIEISDKDKKQLIEPRLKLKKFIIFSDSNTVKIDAREKN